MCRSRPSPQITPMHRQVVEFHCGRMDFLHSRIDECRLLIPIRQIRQLISLLVLLASYNCRRLAPIVKSLHKRNTFSIQHYSSDYTDSCFAILSHRQFPYTVKKLNCRLIPTKGCVHCMRNNHQINSKMIYYDRRDWIIEQIGQGYWSIPLDGDEWMPGLPAELKPRDVDWMF